MSAIWGITLTDGKAISKNINEAMIKRLSIYKLDYVKLWCDNNVLLGCGMQFITPESLNEVLPYYDENKGLSITADAIIDNRQELFCLLQIEIDKQEFITDSEIILKAFEKWGKECPKYLVGDFAFVIWNEKNKELFCARDHVGKRSFYYSFINNTFAFSTVIRLFLDFHTRKMELNDLWIADFLYLEGPVSEFDGDKTIYKDIHQLLPAHTLTFKDNKISINKYWDPLDLPKIKLKSDKEYEDTFKELFFEAVRCRTRCNGDIGVMLSGGLDSSSVACVAARELDKRGKRIKAYSSIPFSGYKDYLPNHLIADEREYIESIRDLIGNIDISYVSTEDSYLLRDIDYFLNLLEGPYKIFENIPWMDRIVKLSKDNGCSILLDGQFGNASVSYGNYSTHIVSLFKKGKFIKLLKEVYGYSRFNNMNIYKAIKKSSKIVLPNKILKAIKPNYKVNEDYKPIMPISEDLLNKHKVIERFKAGYYQPNKKYDLAEVRKFIMSPRQFTQIGILETKQSLIYGIVRRDPTRDKRIIEFCMRIPGNQFVRNAQERYLIRRAMKGIIPEKIRLNYSKRGRQAADWVQILQPQWQEIKEEISELYNNDLLKNYIDMDKLKEIQLKVDNYPDEKNQYLVKALITILILKRYIETSNNDK